MKFIGDEMLHSGEVISTEFVDNAIKFNRLKATSISSVDLQTVNENVIITTEDDHNVHLYNSGINDWDTWDVISKRNRITLNSIGDQFNYIHFLNDAARYLEVDNLVYENLDNTHDFVIDWYMLQYSANSNGCLMFNGSTSSPDPVTNKELCITTSGDIVDPDTLEVTTNSANDGYLNILYPPLKSLNQINNDLWHHYALVAKDGAIQLIIDSKVNDENTFDNISDVENVLFGHGYSDGIEAYVGKVRLTKGTDLGWFGGGFDLPDTDIIPDGNTEFLMDSTSLVDTTTNYTITSHGDDLNIYQENHYVYLQPSHYNSIVKLDFASTTTIYLPSGDEGKSLVLYNANSTIVLKSMVDDLDDYLHFYSRSNSTELTYVDDGWKSNSQYSFALVPESFYKRDIAVHISTVSGSIANYGTDSRCSPAAHAISGREYDKYNIPLVHIPNVIDCRAADYVYSGTLGETGVDKYDTIWQLSFLIRPTHYQPSQNAYVFSDSGNPAYHDSIRFCVQYTSYSEISNYERWRVSTNLKQSDTACNYVADDVYFHNMSDVSEVNMWPDHQRLFNQWFKMDFLFFYDDNGHPAHPRRSVIQRITNLRTSVQRNITLTGTSDCTGYTYFRMANTITIGHYLIADIKIYRLPRLETLNNTYPTLIE